jgi:hypothetical protein
MSAAAVGHSGAFLRKKLPDRFLSLAAQILRCLSESTPDLDSYRVYRTTLHRRHVLLATSPEAYGPACWRPLI